MDLDLDAEVDVSSSASLLFQRRKALKRNREKGGNGDRQSSFSHPDSATCANISKRNSSLHASALNLNLSTSSQPPTIHNSSLVSSSPGLSCLSPQLTGPYIRSSTASNPAGANLSSSSTTCSQCRTFSSSPCKRRSHSPRNLMMLSRNLFTPARSTEPAASKQRTTLSISIPPLNSNLPVLPTKVPQTSVEESFDHVPFDQQIKQENAYPDGPVLVCEPNIYLFSEPSAEIAMQYDVVINVAREVKAPFKDLPVSQSDAAMYPYPETYPPSDSSSSDCQVFSPTLSGQSSPSSCLSTSSSNSLSDRGEKPPHVEYIYIPWGHSSDLSGDLERLTDLIEDRSLQGKRILIHCQCGVSRSASLVVAYVMRQQKCSLNTAYSYVKQRSPQISPNMTLMFQLMDWSTTLRAKYGYEEMENDD